MTVNFNFDFGSIVDFIGIIVNAFLAYWVVNAIQKNIDNKRVLKDHFIVEVKEIRDEYRKCLHSLYSNRTPASLVTPWFKLMNIKINDLMEIVNRTYGINKDVFLPYQNDLRELITNNVDFIAQFNTGNPVVFGNSSKADLIRFQQDHQHLFNDVIIQINNAR